MESSESHREVEAGHCDTRGHDGRRESEPNSNVKKQSRWLEEVFAAVIRGPYRAMARLTRDRSEALRAPSSQWQRGVCACQCRGMSNDLPSDQVGRGRNSCAGTRVISRHGKGCQLMPSSCI